MTSRKGGTGSFLVVTQYYPPERGAAQVRLAALARELHRATGAAGQLLALSGPRTTYDGALGVIREGAFADLLVVDGDPEAGLDWLDDPENLRLIMKGGRFVKQSL